MSKILGVVTAELVFHRGKVAKNKEVMNTAYELGYKLALSLK